MSFECPFSLMAGDLRAKARWVYGTTTFRDLLKALFTDGTFAMVVYRLMQASQRLGLVPLTMLFNKLNAVCAACIIGRGAEFGPEFVLVHSQGVVINGKVKGGRNVMLEHQVTIGADRDASPVLGDEVFVGAGAKIIGGVRVGNRVKVGANAVVVDDVPDDSTVVGVPARPVGRTDWGRRGAGYGSDHE
jgi:serine O-acetyltransferase